MFLLLGNVVVVKDADAPFGERPLVIDFGLSVCHGEVTSLTWLTATASARFSERAESVSLLDLPRDAFGWRPRPEDDLESVALIGEWLVGELPDGHRTSSAAKRELLGDGRARERWGIVVPAGRKSSVPGTRRRALGDLSQNLCA